MRVSDILETGSENHGVEAAMLEKYREQASDCLLSLKAVKPIPSEIKKHTNG